MMKTYPAKHVNDFYLLEMLEVLMRRVFPNKTEILSGVIFDIWLIKFIPSHFQQPLTNKEDLDANLLKLVVPAR